MGKITIILFLALLELKASTDFQERCIKCHKAEGIPTQELYKRYLLKYSSHTAIKAAMLKYLKNPSIKTSIMPEPFITKFGLQQKTQLSDEALKRYIDELVNTYTLKNKLYIPTP